MKFRSLFFFLFLLAINHSAETDPLEDACTSVEPSQKEDCDIFNTTVINEGYHCCYSEYEYKYQPNDGGDIKGYSCTLLDNDDYTNKDSYIEEAKSDALAKGNELIKFAIDCQSVFIKSSFVSLVALLLL